MNVGDYVRTKDGRIIKVENYNEQPNNPLFETLNGKTQMKGTIIKSSPNIVDLIQVGDILYLEESDDIACMFFRDIYLVKNEDNLLNMIDDIKNKKCKLISIVTKEQFSSMEYKI